MDWPFHLQEERRREGRAAALEDAHGERPGCRLERQAQAGGRGFMDGLARPPERDEGGAHLGSDREAPQLLVARARQPGKQRVAAGGAQRLLGGPQGIAPARGPDHDKLREVDPCGGQRRRVGQVRRRKPDHALARRGEVELPAALLEELDLERFGELLQLHGDGGLGEVQLFRGARDAAEARDGLEDDQLGEKPMAKVTAQLRSRHLGSLSGNRGLACRRDVARARGGFLLPGRPGMSSGMTAAAREATPLRDAAILPEARAPGNDPLRFAMDPIADRQ